jgi:ABC-2 type transport system ATP-binding protein
MQEAEYCDRIAIIDKGEVIAIDSPANLKKQFGKETIEEVFLKLTGRKIREEEASTKDQFRNQLMAHQRR